MTCTVAGSGKEFRTPTKVSQKLLVRDLFDKTFYNFFTIIAIDIL